MEQRLGASGELEPVRGLANKLPEHAARIAAALTLVENMAPAKSAPLKWKPKLRLRNTTRPRPCACSAQAA
jgi:hypothetical protein